MGTVPGVGRPAGSAGQKMAFGCPVGLNAFISASSLATSGESYAGGGPTLGCPSQGTSQVFQLPAFGTFGLLPTHLPGPVGIGTSAVGSNWSCLARSTTFAPTARPRSNPALASLGYWTPARTRDRAAASACS